MSVHDPINCFDKENEISNINLILNLLGCLSNKKMSISKIIIKNILII